MKERHKAHQGQSCARGASEMDGIRARRQYKVRESYIEQRTSGSGASYMRHKAGIWVDGG